MCRAYSSELARLKGFAICVHLIAGINSLMTRFNSLLGANKFPVPMRRELGRKTLNLALDSEPIVHWQAATNKIPCICALLEARVRSL